MSILLTGTFDLEAEDWDKYVMGGAYDGKVYESFRSQSDFLDHLLERGGVWWGHYAGRYDMLCLLGENAERRGIPVRLHMAGARITCARFGNRLTLRDTFALAPVSLDKFARLVNLKKTEPDLPCTCDEPCGGYCSIRRNMPRAQYQKVDSYMENDCRILHSAFSYWLEFLRRHFGEPCGTIGASAYKFTKRTKASWTTSIYNFVKKCYYGGLTMVNLRESPRGSRERWIRRAMGESVAPERGGTHDDINSAYVDALRFPMPVGEPTETIGHVPRDAKFYCAEAVVTIPDWEIPPLPIRGKDRLYYPTGRVFGRWNQTMLDAAVEDGAKIEKFGRVVSWGALDTPYTEFCENAWNLRKAAIDEAKKDGKDATAAKLLKSLSVSVAGKLAQRAELREVRFSPTPLLGWKSYNPSNLWWYKDSFKIADCAHVHHAGVMTGKVQVRIRRRMEIGQGAYCDTDGGFFEKRVDSEVGDELGLFQRSNSEKGHDGSYYDLDCPAPKLYRYMELREEFRAKGFGLGRTRQSERFQQIVAGSEIEINRGTYSLVSALHKWKDGSVFHRIHETRKFHPDSVWCGGRIKVGERGTRAPTIEEVRERLELEPWDFLRGRK